MTNQLPPPPGYIPAPAYYYPPQQPQRIVVLKPINHFGHAVATFFTGGLWGFVWLGVVLNRKFQR